MYKYVYTEKIDQLQLRVFSTREQMGKTAAYDVANAMKDLLQKKDKIRMVFAAAPSQSEFLKTLTEIKDIPWEKVEAFHMDEYIGLDLDAPQRFSGFLRKYLFDIIKPGKVQLIMPDKADPDKECERYAALLDEQGIDIVCLGIGENGHIAFNDPPVADFNDPKKVKIVELDHMCRQQQVNDGCFNSIDEVPTHAVTLTIPALLSAGYLFSMVPGVNKKEAVYNSLRGPVTTGCPASILRNHSNCILYVDRDSFPIE
ncbi:glucosamine-6-phosphate deaminase [Anaerocolumna aminovalerica]|jgi:glucosamine-6-phosphate deaminase|uniref:Glucosamine-6-phosphate deaminase n=1 Tax=Anaerocolumna aminovalerica TaxID=1527 RepID=A0A1I5H3E8_9FIRM|nr:glucosamine-6-phosphate deaminase [Anaerocolumna aminovalerica]SFO42848.1 glucosamine-6-phosphate deaminase [Anaerocolumna aminovalerica]